MMLAPELTRCSCAVHDDGSVTTFLCPTHADTDPCLTMSQVTGRRRVGTIRRGVCSHCGHGAGARRVIVLEVTLSEPADSDPLDWEGTILSLIRRTFQHTSVRVEGVSEK